MSLTSYRAAPPRGIRGQGTKDSRGGGAGAAFYCSLISVLWDRNAWLRVWVLGLLPGRPGGDLLSRVLGRSTIGAEGFHGRVRDGIGCRSPRHNHQVVAEQNGQNRVDEVLLCCEAEDLGLRP